MSTVIFAGPSLPPRDHVARRGWIYAPPAACGDIARAVAGGAARIGLIDGRFETAASPWHKEILWAMERGARVWGAASMGALRAAELAPYGMIGVGRIFRDYAAGRLVDDDEVAILHGPAEAGFAPVSLALVNIRHACARARAAGVLSPADHDHVITAARATFYKDRRWENVLADVPPRARARFARWIAGRDLDLKRADARALLAAIGAVARRRHAVPRTIYLIGLLRRLEIS